MTSRDFNGTSSTIDVNSSGGLGAKTDSPWSACVWATWDGSGEGTIGHFFFADTNAFRVRFESSASIIGVRQISGGTAASIVTSAPSFAMGTWYCLIATYDGLNCHLFWGTPNGPMQEATYSTNTSISGGATTWGTRVYVGNNSAAGGTFDGRLLHPAVLDWVMSPQEMERYRTGDLSVLFARGNPRVYFTFSDGSALLDSSRRNQAVTTSNTTNSGEMPPGVAFDWDFARNHPLRRAVATGASTQNVVMDLVTNTPTVFEPTVAHAGSAQNVAMDLVTNTPTVFEPTVTLAAAAFAETWTGADGLPWPAQWTTAVSTAGTVADIQSGKGRMATGTVASGKVGARNTAALLSSAYTMTVDITVPVFTEWYYLIHVRAASSLVNTYKLVSSYQIRFSRNGSVIEVTFYEVDASGNESFRASGGVLGGSPVAGDTIRIMVQVGAATLKEKAWKVGTSEPAYTDLSSSIATTYTGMYFMLSVQGGANTTSENFLWDDFSIVTSAQTAELPLVTNTPTVFSPAVIFPLNETFSGVSGPPGDWWTLGTVGSATIGLDNDRLKIVTPVPLDVGRALFTDVLPADVDLRASYTFTVATNQTPGFNFRGDGIWQTSGNRHLFTNGLCLIPSAFGDTVRLFTTVASASSALGSTYSLVIGATDTVNFHVVTSGSTVLWRAWIDGTSEPAVWQTVTDSNHFERTRMGVALQNPTAAPTTTAYWDDITAGVLSAEQTVVLPLVTNTSTVFTPSVNGIQNTVLPRVTNPFTVFTPAIQIKQYPVLNLIINTMVVFNPTVTRGAVTAVLPLVSNTPTVFAPSVAAAVQTISVPMVYALTTNVILDENGLPILDEDGLVILDASGSVFAPSVIHYSISVPLVVNTPVVFEPTVTASTLTITVPLVTNTPVVFEPATSALVDVPLVTNTPTVFAPSVRDTQTVTVPTVTNTPVVFAPSIASNQTVTMQFVTSPSSVFAPTVIPNWFPVLPLVTSPQTVFPPSVTTGTNIVVPKIINTPVVFEPSVSGGLVAVEMELVTNIPVVFTPLIGFGVYLFVPPHDEDGPRKLSELGRRRAGVSRKANELSQYFPAPHSYSVLKIGGVYVQMDTPTVEQINSATEYYAGGHIYEVDYPTAAALQAAGFDVEGVTDGA